MRQFWIKTALIFAIVFMAYAFYRRNIVPKQVATPSEEVEAVKLPNDFNTFYDRFQSDSIFQLDHIMFPLLKISDEDESLPSEMWERNTWKLHRPFNAMNGAFDRSFIYKAPFVTEQIVDLTGEFSMVRRFAKIEDQWMLIYYQPMGKYVSSEGQSPKISIQ